MSFTISMGEISQTQSCSQGAYTDGLIAFQINNPYYTGILPSQVSAA
jgi:hypothetical protein